MTEDTRATDRAKPEALLSPETRELLAELYGAWWQYSMGKLYVTPFLEWLEYTAGNCWLEAGKQATADTRPPR